MLRMVSYSRRPQSGHIVCYLNRTYHVLTTHVTSNLALHSKRADHIPGEGSIREGPGKASNSFIVKILTSKPLALKILQTLFGNPAPLKAFRGGWGGGIPLNTSISQNSSPEIAASETQIAK